MVAEPLRGLGASRVPVIAGASPWQTPVALWLELMGLSTRPDTAPMAAGRALEGPIIAMTAAVTGQRILRNRRSFPHPDYPAVPLWATPDGFTPRRYALVEVKMVGHRFGDWSDGPPAYVNLQVQAQLACLPRSREGLVAALIGGELKTYRVERDEVIQAELPSLVAEWYRRHIQEERAPEPESPDDRWSLLRVAAAAGGRAERAPTPAEAQAAAELLVLLRHQAETGEQIEARRLLLAEGAVEADLAGPGFKARWGERSSTDWAGLADELGIQAADVERHTRRTKVFTFRRTSRDKGDDEARINIVGLVPSGVFR